MFVQFKFNEISHAFEMLMHLDVFVEANLIQNVAFSVSDIQKENV